MEADGLRKFGRFLTSSTSPKTSAQGRDVGDISSALTYLERLRRNRRKLVIFIVPIFRFLVGLRIFLVPNGTTECDSTVLINGAAFLYEP